MSGHKAKSFTSRIKYLIAGFLLLLTGFAFGGEAKALNVKDIPAAIKDGDPKELAKYIFSDPAKESAVLKQIESGDKEWVKLFPKILSGTDAGWTEKLLIAIPSGLKNSPKEVLEAIKKAQILVPQLENIAKNNCGNTGEGYDETQPQKKLAKSSIKELNARKKSLIMVKDEALSKEKEECIAGIEYSKKRWAKQLNNSASRTEEDCKKSKRKWDAKNNSCS